MTYFSLKRKNGCFENISPNFDAKGKKKEQAVPFCVPLILEASVPASFLSNFRGSRSCLVPQKKERVPFGSVPAILCKKYQFFQLNPCHSEVSNMACFAIVLLSL